MSTTESSGRAPQRSRGAIIALALSLAVNVFLVGALIGHFYFRGEFGRPQTPIQRFERVAHEMNLNGPQLAAFRVMIATVRDHRRAMFLENHPLFDEVWDELGKPQPDDRAIADLIARANANHLTFAKEATAAMETFLASLNPAQRAQFAELAKRRGPRAAQR